MTNLDSVLKNRHHFADKGPDSQSYGFSGSQVWMWELDHKESWVLKNWGFWTVLLGKTLKRPLDCKEINQSILKEISPEYSLEGLMLKLKLQYFGHLMWRADSLEKTRMLGKIGSRRRRGCQRMRWLDGIMMQWTWTWANFGKWWGTRRPGVRQPMGSHRVRHDWATEQQ